MIFFKKKPVKKVTEKQLRKEIEKAKLQRAKAQEVLDKQKNKIKKQEQKARVIQDLQKELFELKKPLGAKETTSSRKKQLNQFSKAAKSFGINLTLGLIESLINVAEQGRIEQPRKRKKVTKKKAKPKKKPLKTSKKRKTSKKKPKRKSKR